MDFNDLLLRNDIDPREVIAFRHRPKERDLRKVLPSLAVDKPHLFNAYQQTQGKRVEKSMTKARYVASFVGHEPGKATFVGLYKIGRTKRITLQQYWRMREHVELKKLGMKGFTGKDRKSCLWFDLKLTRFYSAWKGKLIVDWPGKELSWWRRSHKNNFTVSSILEDSVLVDTLKRWNEIDLTWGQLTGLPRRWQLVLSQWRGVYYIFDTKIRKGYVGSAYSAENLFGRWCNYRHRSSYASSGHGGNKLLRNRNPRHFRFTILELVSQSAKAKEVIALETSWKERLHSRKPSGLNDN